MIENIATAALEKLALKAGEKALSWLASTDAPKHGFDLQARLVPHLTEISRWASRVEFYGLTQAKETDSDTIPLTITDEPRRFRAADSSGAELGEDRLLEGNRHYLLLGSPGAGKTTTLKRLVRRVLLSPPVAGEDRCQYPIVVRLRDLPGTSSLLLHLADLLGIAVVTKKLKRERDHIFKRFCWDTDRLLEDVLPELLSLSGALLLVDGLDEIGSAHRQTIDMELRTLALRMPEGKIIVSCRSGEYTRHIEGYDVLEICPLSPHQVLQIASAWLGEPDAFMAELQQSPFEDVVDRPLLLTQLMTIFYRYGQLPEQPIETYRKLITLLLTKWDEDKDVRRASRYAHFGPERKLDFLAAISYLLTYRCKSKVFSESDLLAAYRTVHESFGLPADEAHLVADEIESHNGLICHGPGARFEFSHLSLQEYLCAYHLVRNPFPKRIEEYLRDYAAPVAIAVCLAGEPDLWFAHCVLNERINWKFDPLRVGEFLSRLLVERPMFGSSSELGIAVLKLLFLFGSKRALGDIISDFVSMSSVRQAARKAMQCYDWYTARRRRTVKFNLKKVVDSRIELEMPTDGEIPSRIVKAIIREEAKKHKGSGYNS